MASSFNLPSFFSSILKCREKLATRATRSKKYCRSVHQPAKLAIPYVDQKKKKKYESVLEETNHLIEVKDRKGENKLNVQCLVLGDK